MTGSGTLKAFDFNSPAAQRLPPIIARRHAEPAGTRQLQGQRRNARVHPVHLLGNGVEPWKDQ